MILRLDRSGVLGEAEWAEKDVWDVRLREEDGWEVQFVCETVSFQMNRVRGERLYEGMGVGNLDLYRRRSKQTGTTYWNRLNLVDRYR